MTERILKEIDAVVDHIVERTRSAKHNDDICDLYIIYEDHGDWVDFYKDELVVDLYNNKDLSTHEHIVVSMDHVHPLVQYREGIISDSTPVFSQCSCGNWSKRKYLLDQLPGPISCPICTNEAMPVIERARILDILDRKDKIYECNLRLSHGEKKVEADIYRAHLRDFLEEIA